MADVLRRNAKDYRLEDEKDVAVLLSDGVELTLRAGARVVRGAVERRGTRLKVHYEGLVYEFEIASADRPKAAVQAAASALYAPMTGRIVKVFVSDGETVASGATLMVVEAMKMEHKIVAPANATIARLHVAAGVQVEVGAELVTLKLEGSP
jgi:biotin carboxyl carrier protein